MRINHIVKSEGLLLDAINNCTIEIEDVMHDYVLFVVTDFLNRIQINGKDDKA